MGRPSSKQDILYLFYNQPTRQWRFCDIVKAVGIAENKVSRWLKLFIEQKIIIKHLGEKPYYVANYTGCEYKVAKRIYAINILQNSGLLDYLTSQATIILFGSFARGDWHQQSDIDLFVLGKKIQVTNFELVLGRNIQIFHYKNVQNLEKISKDLLLSVIKGIIITGSIDFIEVNINEAGISNM